ncbi:hypothetical protein ElyMa_005602400 [Elysia marginata]|uniref:DUF6451 domain-containing protein n=1 Tax=Elysia marginata TaxID=1093978 RepID=A0AAV4F6Z8_9GAST|nr:hypothetical protein ElyMa_005602400 [Elysia marginata]
MDIFNRFYALKTIGDVEDIDNNWNKIKGVWKGSCKEVLGLRGKQNKEWITNKTTMRIKERKKAKAGLNTITVEGEKLEDVDSFTDLESTINKDGGVEEDVNKRIQETRQASSGLKKIWSSKIIEERTKSKISNSNVKAVLFYGTDTWRTNKTTLQRLQSLSDRCMRRIISIHWPEIISNTGLWERAQQQPMKGEMRRRK